MLKIFLGCDLFNAMVSPENLMKKNDDSEVYLSSIYKDGHIVSQAGFKKIHDDKQEKCVCRLYDKINNKMLNGCVKWYQQQLDNQQNQYAFFTNCFTRLEFLINEIEFNQNVDILDSVKNEIDFFLGDPEFQLSNNFRVLKYIGSLSHNSKDLNRVFSYFIRKLQMSFNWIISAPNEQAYNELILHYSYCWQVIYYICNLYVLEIILTKSALKKSDVDKYEAKLKDFFYKKFYVIDSNIRKVLDDKSSNYWTHYQERNLIEQFFKLNPDSIFSSQLTNLSQIPYICENILKQGVLVEVRDN